MAKEEPFPPGTLVKLLYHGNISESVYGVEAYSEHFDGYMLISHDGRTIHAKKENVVMNDDDTFIFNIKQFKAK